tara:strand:+ start:1159 stop:1359 length:201 start_codon:yes stop_codon:yes gene_type:complete
MLNNAAALHPIHARPPLYVTFTTFGAVAAPFAALDDAALKDLSLTRHDATREATRPFWDTPNTWRM